MEKAAVNVITEGWRWAVVEDGSMTIYGHRQALRAYPDASFETVATFGTRGEAEDHLGQLRRKAQAERDRDVSLYGPVASGHYYPTYDLRQRGKECCRQCAGDLGDQDHYHGGCPQDYYD